MSKPIQDVKIMPAGLPFVATGAVWLVLAVILPVYKLLPLLVCAVCSIAVFAALSAGRKAQIAKLPPAPAVKVRAEELAKKLDVCRDKLLQQEGKISDTEVRHDVHSLATTLDLIADEVEKDPKERGKVRKLANHYGEMIIGLVDKYILLESQAKAAAAAEGGNVAGTMTRIKEGLAAADAALKKVLDDMFSDDAIEVSADINVLEQLLKTEGSENRMDFSGLDM